jgi:Holliday junction DNA helicase RuvB
MMRAEITTPEILSDESVVELSLRPQRLAEFIGQPKVKESLRIYIDAALLRREPLDQHSFLDRPDWQDDARRADARARWGERSQHIGPGAGKTGDLVGTLTNLREGDILFIDEIHRLRPIIEEFLYPAMEDFKIDIRLSEGPKAQTITMPIEKFTLVARRHARLAHAADARTRSGSSNGLNFYPPSDWK